MLSWGVNGSSLPPLRDHPPSLLRHSYSDADFLSSKFTPFFDDCIGALDGTHHPMSVPQSEHSRYRNRKGTLSQNVLAACDFDGRFVYVLPGWEGSAHDSKVLQDATSNHEFFTPKGKYWLADAGYWNSEFVMVPYRGVRYHLKEQQQANLRS